MLPAFDARMPGRIAPRTRSAWEDTAHASMPQAQRMTAFIVPSEPRSKVNRRYVAHSPLPEGEVDLIPD